MTGPSAARRQAGSPVPDLRQAARLVAAAYTILEHQQPEAAALADRILLLSAGRVARVVEGGHDAASLEVLLIDSSVDAEGPKS